MGGLGQLRGATTRGIYFNDDAFGASINQMPSCLNFTFHQQPYGVHSLNLLIN